MRLAGKAAIVTGAASGFCAGAPLPNPAISIFLVNNAGVTHPPAPLDEVCEADTEVDGGRCI